MPAEAQSLKEVFLGALAIAPPERAAWLDQACGPDAEMRRQVEQMLAAHDAPQSLLDQPLLAAPPSETATATPGETLGTMIGPYKLLEQIGEGGFGVVYLAEQTEPVRRKVALKILKPGMDTRQIVARFEAERQALAIMDHPNIAKVFDGGMTQEPAAQARDSAHALAGAAGSGRPYFVMELVKGVPITDYCDQNHLTPRQRLELFIPVCQAVQHAHQKGIIHRDLKPSNVLVTRHDSTAVPKVIDFGVAKALGQELTDKTLFTGVAQMIGTPLYMSPEQAGMSDLDVDTRSDIYSLGVLLYELLTGTTPFEKERFKKAAYDEIRRIIREEEPPKPSTRLSALSSHHAPRDEPGLVSRSETATLASVSALRQTEPAKLTKLVRGELDWIVMKCLEKDRNRRYESSNGLAIDLMRYLADEPVQAGPPSTWYRFRKFARRNRGPVLAIGISLFLVAAGITGTTVGLVRALSAEKRAVVDRDEKEAARRQTRQALNTMTDEVVEDLLARQPEITERHQEFLKKVLVFHEEFAKADASDPDGRQSRAEGFLHVGSIRMALGEMPEAEGAYRAAITLYKQLVHDFPTRQDSRHGLIRCYLDMSHLQSADLVGSFKRPASEAIADLREAVTLGKQLVAESNQVEFRRDLAKAELNLGLQLLFNRNQANDAEALFTDAVEINKKLVNEFPQEDEYLDDLSTCHYNLGLLFNVTNRRKQAEAAYHEVLDIQRRLLTKYGERPEFRKSVMNCYQTIAVMNDGLNDPTNSEKAWQKCVEIGRKLAAEFPNNTNIHFQLALSLSNLGKLLRDAKKLPEALTALQDELARYQYLAAKLKTRPDMRFQVAVAFHNVGVVLMDLDRLTEGEKAWRDGIAVGEKLVAEFSERSDYHFNLAFNYDELGHFLREHHRLPEAVAAWREALGHYEKLRANKNVFFAELNLGLAFAFADQLDDAIAEFKKAITINKEHPDVHYQLGRALQTKGLFGEAIAEYETALRLNKDFKDAQQGLKEARRLSDLAKRLSAIIGGKDKAKNAGELLGIAQICQTKSRKQYANAVRFFAQAFAANPKLAEKLDDWDRYNAACAAALTARGDAKDAGKIDDKERARMRRQALDWLRADLKSWGALLEKEPKKAPMAAEVLTHWLEDPDFAGVRAEVAITKLPEAERADWQRLWKDVAAMLKLAQQKVTPKPQSK